MNWLRRIGFIAALSTLALALGVSSAIAATLSEVVDDAAATGFYIDRNVSISETEASEIVGHARNEGSAFYLVVLEDSPLGGNTAFAEAIYDELGINAGTILVLSPDDVGVFTEDEGFSDDLVNEALDYADEVAFTDGEYAAAFVVGLVGVATEDAAPAATAAPQTTAATTSSSSSSSSGGGGSGIFIFLAFIVGVGLLLFWLVRRGKKQTVNAAAEQMAKARAAVQNQVDAIANDILDMEDEVRVANNDEADENYNAASATYRTVTERLQQANTPQELVGLSNDLDVAIWQLDCAEAVLDGKSKPPRPEPKRFEPQRPADDRVTIPAPRDDYQRRPGRRSSYSGSGVMEILIGVAGQVLAGGGRSGSSSGGMGGFGGLFGGGRSTRRSSTPTSGSGGGVVPGPGSPTPRSTGSTRSTPRSSGRRRSGGGKVRVSRKRRRRR